MKKKKIMWRRFWSCSAVKQGMSAAIGGRKRSLLFRQDDPFLLLGGLKPVVGSSPSLFGKALVSSTTQYFSTNSEIVAHGGRPETISYAEAKKLLRLVNVEALKIKLGAERNEVVAYSELLDACQSIGVARSADEATAFARVLDDAGVVLLFRDKVYLHPEKVVDLVRRAVPLALTAEDDPMREELKKLQAKKENIDVIAHQQVRRILWGGLGAAIVQVSLFFRLTFWEFSWDVMEPVTFFTTATGLVIGYAYFLFTSRDPTYQDLMKRLFLSRQRKLFKKYDFDVDRYKELQRKCYVPLDAATSIRKHMGLVLELEDAVHHNKN